MSAVPLLWLLLVAAPAVRADDAPDCDSMQQAINAEQDWLGACGDAVVNTSDEVLDALSVSREDLSRSCLTFQEPCSMGLKPAPGKWNPSFAQSPLILRCQSICTASESGPPQCQSPPPQTMCTPKAGWTSAGGNRRSADGGADSDAAVATAGGGNVSQCGVPDAGPVPATAWAWAQRCVEEARKTTNPKSNLSLMWEALGLAQGDRNNYPNDMNLRNAEHFLFAWVYSNGGKKVVMVLYSVSGLIVICPPGVAASGAFMTTLSCVVVTAYSSVKAVAYPVRILLGKMFGGGPASDPAIEEIIWGCKGAIYGGQGDMPPTK
jgi:hypothetical protein